MECFLIGVVIVVFVVISIISEQSQRTRRINQDFRQYNQGARRQVLKQELGNEQFSGLQRAFETVASERGGNFVAGLVPLSPQVIFTYRGTRVLLSVQDTLKAQRRLREEIARFYTRLTFKVPPGWKQRLEIFPQTNEIDANFLKMYDIEIGAGEFDRRYVIKSSESDFAKDFLDVVTREAIDRLCNLPPFVGIIVSLNRERMILSKASVITDVSILRRFVDEALRIYDRIDTMLDAAAGLKVVETGGIVEKPICNVCGAEIEAAAQVVCQRCETPLHRECWHYNKKCAVFGCGGMTFR